MATLRERVRRRDELLGVFLQIGSPVVAELAAKAGFDWVVIDLEHGAGSEADLLAQLLCLRPTETPAVVRVESPARLRIGRALDLGAVGVLVPQISDAATASNVATWLRYPPTGLRGVALSARSSGYGTLKHDQTGEVDESVLGIAQIETRTSLNELEEIARVPGIDALFVGPSDLSHSIGRPGQFTDPDFAGALSRIVTAAERHQRALGVHVTRPSELKRYRELGFTLFTIGADALSLLEAFRGLLSTARGNSA